MLALERVITEHAGFARNPARPAKVLYGSCFDVTRQVLFIAGKTGKPNTLQNEKSHFFFLNGHIANVQLST